MIMSSSCVERRLKMMMLLRCCWVGYIGCAEVVWGRHYLKMCVCVCSKLEIVVGSVLGGEVGLVVHGE